MNQSRLLSLWCLVCLGLALVASCDYIINTPPTAWLAATPTVGHAPLTVQFDASASTDPQGDDPEYYWRFGDGTMMVTDAPAVPHVYTEPGTYTVKLYVYDGYESSETVEITIVVLPGGAPDEPEHPQNIPPTCAFEANPPSGPFPLTVFFNAASSHDPDGSIVSYVWQFGDGTGNITTTSQILHTFIAPGTYTVALDGNRQPGGYGHSECRNHGDACSCSASGKTLVRILNLAAQVDNSRT